MAKKCEKKRRDIYQETTDRIIERLDKGDLPPWRIPIVTAEANRFPKNHSTGKDYRGVNVWLLTLTAWAEGYDSARWLTFKQAKELGGQVRKGERGSLVTFWTRYNKKDKETGEETVLPVLKHYVVFNLDQIDGVEPPGDLAIDPAIFSPIDRAQAILDGFAEGPPIHHRGHRACYYPKLDEIEIAPPERFDPRESYYATLFHECAHSTGHERRLRRGIDTDLAPFGSANYSKEELVAEMASAFLCAVAGISPATIEQSASYIHGWSKAFKDDKKLLITAAGQAQKAADHILGVAFGEAAGEPESDAAPAAPRGIAAPEMAEPPAEAGAVGKEGDGLPTRPQDEPSLSERQLGLW